MYSNPDIILYPPDDHSLDVRRSLLNYPIFISLVYQWVKARPVLANSDGEPDILASLIVGELDEVDEYRQIEGMKECSFSGEVGEVVDVFFFLVSAVTILAHQGKEFNTREVVVYANGQSVGSGALERLTEVAGNLDQQFNQKTVEYLWMLMTSYLLHMREPVDLVRVLKEYTLPKNSGNHTELFLKSNSLFESAFHRKMNHDEMKLYFNHYRKALRIIRKFIAKYVDNHVGDTGLKPEYYSPYALYIQNFMYFAVTKMTPEQALLTLKAQLYTDYAEQVAVVGDDRLNLSYPNIKM